MKMVPVARSRPAPVDISVSEGLDPALDSVAAVAPPRNRFLTRSWFAAAIDAAPKACAVRTLVVRWQGQPVIALPVVQARPGVRTVPGCYWPFRGFPIAEGVSPDLLAALLRDRRAAAAIGAVLRVGPIYADDPALLTMRAAARMAGITLVERRIATSFVLSIAEARADGPWPRASTLKKLRFHEKHLGAHGALRWRYVTGDQWTPAAFDDLAAIEARSWHGRTPGADTKFLEGGTVRFWRALAADPAQAARMWAAILDIDGAPAAFSFDLDVGDTKYAIANSYDPAFAKHSPGKCLYYRNLVEAIDRRGITTVDWGAGDSGYKETIGARPGAEIVDCLLIRLPLPGPARALAQRLWARTGQRGGASRQGDTSLLE